MSWDYRAGENGCLEVIVSRWYNQKHKKEVRLIASGFVPFEPVQIEVIGADKNCELTPKQISEIENLR